MADNTIGERMERYIARQKERGQTKVCVWVPAEQAEYVRNLAERMREHANDNPEQMYVGDPALMR